MHRLEGYTLIKTFVKEGEWVRSEFPHPLVTLDFDKDDNLLSVVVAGTNLGAEGHE